MRIDAFISFGLQAKMSLRRRIASIFQGFVGDTFNVVYANMVATQQSQRSFTSCLRTSQGRSLDQFG
jgi:hypothetical protein